MRCHCCCSLITKQRLAINYCSPGVVHTLQGLQEIAPNKHAAFLMPAAAAAVQLLCAVVCAGSTTLLLL
jgi:hypothetical protein